MEDIVSLILEFVKQFGYVGIFIMTFVESTFVPLPAEITMIPAGYLVQKGEMHMWITLLVAVSGTVGGAWLNYWIALHYGRDLFIRYGKYFFMSQAKLDKMESYFEEHGAISTFTGRLIPGVRHYISFPAGLARMKLRLFLLYTALGGGIWVAILLGVGYYLGENEKEIIRNLFVIKVLLGILMAALISWQVWWRKRNKAKQ